MKVLLTNDLHIASKGPSVRTDNWHETLNRKLDFIETTAKAEEVDAIGIAGDLFHSDSLAFSSGPAAPMTSTIERFRRWSKKWPVLAIPGNHDLRHNRLDLLDQTPFGALLSAGFITPVWEKPWVCKRGGWVGGVPYRVTEDALKDWSRVTDHGPGVLLVHSYASIAGGDHFGERIFSYMELMQWLPNVGCFCFGHDHHDRGIDVIGPQVFVQVGAPLRGTRADDERNRQPAIVVVETTSETPLTGDAASVTVRRVDIPIESAESVFDLSKVAQVDAVAPSDRIAAYVRDLGQATSADTPVTPADIVERLDLPPRVRQAVANYLERASAPE